MTKNVKEVSSVAKSQCFYCNKTHKLINCNSFKSLTYEEKHKFVRVKRLCSICFEW